MLIFGDSVYTLVYIFVLFTGVFFVHVADSIGYPLIRTVPVVCCSHSMPRLKNARLFLRYSFKPTVNEYAPPRQTRRVALYKTSSRGSN